MGERRPSLDNVCGGKAALTHPADQWGKTSPVEPKFHPQAYSEWIAALKRHDLLPSERLLPTITIDGCASFTPGMTASLSCELSAGLLAEVRQHKWGYYFPLSTGESTLGKEGLGGPAQAAKQLMFYRMHAICGGIEELYAGDLTGKCVLDLACNHGAFSLDLLARGAARARGVDLRAENVAKANLLKNHLGMESAEFVQGDIYEETAPHEIVLCLGLLYHVTKPWELVELCYRLCTEMAVIDTVTHREPMSGFVLGFGQLISQEHAAGAINIELHPTYRGLIDMMRAAGFREIVEAEGVPDPSWVGWDREAYATKTRRCLIGIK